MSYKIQYFKGKKEIKCSFYHDAPCFQAEYKSLHVELRGIRAQIKLCNIVKNYVKPSIIMQCLDLLTYDIWLLLSHNCKEIHIGKDDYKVVELFTNKPKKEGIIIITFSG